MNKLIRASLLAAVFATTAGVASTPITVTEQRNLDLRIQSEVMQVLSRSQDLDGRVVVEAKDQVVNLSGHLATQGQIKRAGRDAGSVQGVKYVVNDIRVKVGVVSNN